MRHIFLDGEDKDVSVLDGTEEGSATNSEEIGGGDIERELSIQGNIEEATKQGV